MFKGWNRHDDIMVTGIQFMFKNTAGVLLYFDGNARVISLSVDTSHRGSAVGNWTEFKPVGRVWVHWGPITPVMDHDCSTVRGHRSKNTCLCRVLFFSRGSRDMQLICRDRIAIQNYFEENKGCFSFMMMFLLQQMILVAFQELPLKPSSQIL